MFLRRVNLLYNLGCSNLYKEEVSDLFSTKIGLTRSSDDRRSLFTNLNDILFIVTYLLI
jgi:hypothetical protein